MISEQPRLTLPHHWPTASTHKKTVTDQLKTIFAIFQQLEVVIRGFSITEIIYTFSWEHKISMRKGYCILNFHERNYSATSQNVSSRPMRPFLSNPEPFPLYRTGQYVSYK
jgi:hypothetical protein